MLANPTLRRLLPAVLATLWMVPTAAFAQADGELVVPEVPPVEEIEVSDEEIAASVRRQMAFMNMVNPTFGKMMIRTQMPNIAGELGVPAENEGELTKMLEGYIDTMWEKHGKRFKEMTQLYADSVSGQYEPTEAEVRQFAADAKAMVADMETTAEEFFRRVEPLSTDKDKIERAKKNFEEGRQFFERIEGELTKLEDTGDASKQLEDARNRIRRMTQWRKRGELRREARRIERQIERQQRDAEPDSATELDEGAARRQAMMEEARRRQAELAEAQQDGETAPPAAIVRPGKTVPKPAIASIPVMLNPGNWMAVVEAFIAERELDQGKATAIRTLAQDIISRRETLWTSNEELIEQYREKTAANSIERENATSLRTLRMRVLELQHRDDKLFDELVAKMRKAAQ